MPCGWVDTAFGLLRCHEIVTLGRRLAKQVTSANRGASANLLNAMCLAHDCAAFTPSSSTKATVSLWSCEPRKYRWPLRMVRAHGLGQRGGFYGYRFSGR